jgi:hypothetical protein
VRYFLRSESATICSLLEIRADGPLAPPHDPRHAPPGRANQGRPAQDYALPEGRGRANCWSCLSISCGYQVIPSVQKTPQPVGARHQRHWPFVLASVLRLSPLSKKAWPILCSLFLLPRSNSPRLGFSQERICPRHQLLTKLSSFLTSNVVQRQLNICRPSSISHSVAEPPSLTHQSTAPTSLCHATTRPVETLASAAAAGTIGLLETPQSPTSLQTISQSPSTSARDTPKTPSL